MLVYLVLQRRINIPHKHPY